MAIIYISFFKLRSHDAIHFYRAFIIFLAFDQERRVVFNNSTKDLYLSRLVYIKSPLPLGREKRFSFVTRVQYNKYDDI